VIRLAGALVLAVVACGCGKKPAPPAPYGETPEYREWKGSQLIRRQAASGPADSVPGTVQVRYPQDRSKNREDFVELYLNGQVVQRTRFGPTGGGMTAPFSITITLRPGPNWLDLWDTTTNKYFRFTIDSRQGNDYVLAPTPTGYDATWTKRE
jgi:hypothetical protein